jgi:hypothetical protein
MNGGLRPLRNPTSARTFERPYAGFLFRSAAQANPAQRASAREHGEDDARRLPLTIPEWLAIGKGIA